MSITDGPVHTCECGMMFHFPTTLQDHKASCRVRELLLQVGELQKEREALRLMWESEREAVKNLTAEVGESNRLISAFPKRLLKAVLDEQDRCAKIAEAYWDERDKLNSDLRAALSQAEKNLAYGISTNIRALRRRESDFAERPKCQGCNGDGWVGRNIGHGRWQQDPCPDCAVKRKCTSQKLDEPPYPTCDLQAGHNGQHQCRSNSHLWYW